MKKHVQQFRYYSEDNPNNTPNTTIATLQSGSVFKDTTPILQLGIQSLPGTQFIINSSRDPIIIGSTGIYEIDFSDEIRIDTLSFTTASLYKIGNLDNACLIVDIIYEKEE